MAASGLPVIRVTVDVSVIASCIVGIDAAVGLSGCCGAVSVAAVGLVVVVVVVLAGSGGARVDDGTGPAVVGVGVAAVAGSVVVVDGFGQGVHAAFGGAAFVG